MTDTALVEKTKQQTLQIKKWNVIFHNDNYTPMYFVVDVLMEMFGKNEEQATAIAMHVHEQGKGIAGEYTKEIALQKASDVVKVARANGHPLKATAEQG